MKQKYGPLPLWGWVLVAGGTIGVVILWKKSKAKATPEEPGESFATGPVMAPSVEGGGGGSAGELEALAKALGEAEAKSNSAGLLGAAAPTEPNQSSGTPVSDFLQTEHELEEGGWTRTASSTVPAVASARQAASGGTPGRGGTAFRAGTYKGMAAHIYARAVPGGVGPAKNVIVLGGPRRKNAHAKPGKHEPAHVKPKAQHPASPRVAPTRHTAKAPPSGGTGGTSAPLATHPAPHAKPKRKRR